MAEALENTAGLPPTFVSLSGRKYCARACAISRQSASSPSKVKGKSEKVFAAALSKLVTCRITSYMLCRSRLNEKEREREKTSREVLRVNIYYLSNDVTGACPTHMHYPLVTDKGNVVPRA